MSVLFSGMDNTPAPLDEEAYRAWLISRAQPPIVYHSGAMHLKRLRVLARKINSHVRAALTEGGFTPDDIKEILLQQAIYCGVPAANHAVKEASAIIAELGVLKG